MGFRDVCGRHGLLQAIPDFLCSKVALGCCEVHPLVSLHEVNFDAYPCIIGPANSFLTVAVALLGRFTEPIRRFSGIPRHSVTEPILVSETNLRRGVTLLSRFATPFRRFARILGQAEAVALHDSEVVLCRGVAPVQQRREAFLQLFGTRFPLLPGPWACPNR